MAIGEIGSFKLYELRLVGFNGSQVDLRGVVAELNIYEDLFGFGLSGNMLFGDSYNLQMNLPIIGQERLFVDVGIPKEDGTEFRIKKEFDVFKVSGRGDTNAAYQTLILDFVAPEVTRSVKNKISRAYSRTHDEIVEDILIKDLKTQNKIVKEKARFVEHCVIPNWSPMETIQWISRRSVSDTYNSAGFFCYENTRGEFIFTSLEALVGQPSSAKYTRNFAKLGDGGAERLSSRDIYRIEAIDWTNNFNTQENVATAMYASRLYSADPVSKKYSETDFSYAGSYNKFNHLEQNTKRIGQGSTILEGLSPDRDGNLLSEYSKSNTFFYPKHTGKNGQNTTTNLEWWYQQSLSQSSQFDILKGTMVVNGDPNRRVGEVIDVEIPSVEIPSASGEVKLDTILSGRYLVTAIGHTFSFIRNDYKMAIEIRKDSFIKPLPIETFQTAVQPVDGKQPVGG